MSRDLRTDSERAEEALQWRDRFHGRPDANYARDDDSGDGCLGAIIMFVLATFSIGAGIFYCI